MDLSPLQELFLYIDDTTSYTFVQSTFSEPLAPEVCVKRLVEVKGFLTIWNEENPQLAHNDVLAFNLENQIQDLKLKKELANL